MGARAIQKRMVISNPSSSAANAGSRPVLEIDWQTTKPFGFAALYSKSSYFAELTSAPISAFRRFELLHVHEIEKILVKLWTIDFLRNGVACQVSLESYARQ